MESGFNAFGLRVPTNRRQKGYETVKSIAPTLSKEQQYNIIAKICNHIERDQPFEVVGAVSGLDKDIALIDLTGRYRLLADLMTD